MIFFKGVRDGVDVEVALQWTDAIHEVIFTYANNIHTAEGGTHLSGLKVGADANDQQLRDQEQSLQE